jgi:acetyl-CoA carboxylase biotin carboxyl carrier protein
MKNANGSQREQPLKEQVAALYELMKNEKLEELEIKEDDYYLYLKRKSKKQAPSAPSSAVASSVVKTVTPEPVPEAAPAGQTVKSPITGVLYRAPSPASPPFVKEGGVVDAGKTLCIVEAMKVMNEIKADSRMKVLKILVENGKAVTAGQDLFLVEQA